MDGKSQAWRDAADKLLESLARQNKYIVGDMLIIFLESAGYGLKDYSTLGGVFKRAQRKGIVSRIKRNERPTKQALWLSQIYLPPMSVPSENVGVTPSYLENTSAASHER